MNARGFLVGLLMLLVAGTALAALDTDSPAVKVRIVGYDPVTQVYNISCAIPPRIPGSDVDPRRFFPIDPIPTGENHSSYSTTPFKTWHLSPTNFVQAPGSPHSQAMYHMYCEVQNYSAPPDKRNLAAEIHVDLRTSENKDVPNIYVLKSSRNNLTMKCEPPAGVKRAQIRWAVRSRSGREELPQLDNQRIVNITMPKVGSGWDVVCDVTDKDTLKFSTWDMPIETFQSGPAYIPTIEGCVPGEPCTYVDPSGIPPNGTFAMTTGPNVDVYVNEQLFGKTDGDGKFTTSLYPGIYNLVLRNGSDELSVLIPIATKVTLTRSYTMNGSVPSNTTAPNTSNQTCFNSVNSIPANCTGGVITTDSAAGCRTIICTNGSSSLKISACNKGSFFEINRQTQVGNSIKNICIGNTCIGNNGYVKSLNYPICIGNQTNQTPVNNTPTNQTNTTNPPNTTCSSSVRTIPVSCTSTITSDTGSGSCRTIVCNGLKVLACNKPDGTAQFFEMYRQQSGSAKICLGPTCIQNEGYVKSPNFPIC